MSVFPTITFFIAVGCLFFYEINKAKELEIQDELMKRRK
jgi:glycoside/pentoside/hexuronide:cation symporter, GPH family